MQLTKRKEILTPRISPEFCIPYFTQTVKHFRKISPEILTALETWLETDDRITINTVDFDLQVRKFYNFDNQYRATALKNQGYELLVIWESEYKADKLGTIKRCKAFLNS